MFRKGDEFIPSYRLEQFLGRGQFGEVWRTTAPGRTSAALKIIDLSGKQGSKEFRAVQRVKEIRHANLMPITALWLLDSELRPLEDAILDTYKGEDSVRATLKAPSSGVKPSWLVVAMLLGQGSLSDRLEHYRQQGEAGIPLKELVRFMEEAAKGIDFLNTRKHDLGDGVVSIQHCDIKPANMMLVGDSVLVCDFGLAQVLSDTQTTATGMIGSPAYMAPECILKKPSSATDQYSLAISFVELRTGRLPFVDESYFAVVDAHRTGKLDLSSLTPAEAAVIRRATALNPADRFPTTTEMAAALKTTLEPERLPQTTSKAPLLAAGILGIALASGGGFWFYHYSKTLVKTDPNNNNHVDPNGNSGNDGKNGNNGNKSENTRRLRFVPQNAIVEINDQTATLNENGEVEWDLPPERRVLISVSVDSSSDYAPFSQKFSVKELEDKSFTIQVPFSGDYHLRVATEHVRGGRRREAVDELRKAISLQADTLKAQQQFRDHQDNIATADISSDSRWLVQGSDDKNLSIRSLLLDEGKPAVLLPGHSKLVDTVKISAGDKWIVSASEAEILLWPDPSSIGAGTEPIKLVGHTGDVLVVSLSPNGRWLATGDSDHLIRLWDLTAKSPEASSRELKGHEDQIQALAFSADNSMLASCCYKGELFQWSIKESGTIERKRLAELNIEPRGIRFLDKLQQWVVGTNDGSIAVFSTAGGKPVHESPSSVQNEPISWLLDDPSGRWLCASSGKTVVAFDLMSPEKSPAKNKEWKSPILLEGHLDQVVTGAFVPQADVLVTGSWDGTAMLWNLTAAAPDRAPLRLTPQNSGQIKSVVVSPDGKWLVVQGESGATSVWDLQLCLVMLQALEESQISTKPGVET